MIPQSASNQDTSQCAVVTPSDVDASSTTSSSDGGASVLEAESKSECASDEEELSVEPVLCDLCGQAPCDWELFGEEIWEEGNSLKEQGIENKAIRHHAYKMYTRMRHGVLRRYDRRPLPVCVRGEIMDAWPEANHVYVGFQMAMKDTVEVND
jgi:hypothetical protein